MWAHEKWKFSLEILVSFNCKVIERYRRAKCDSRPFTVKLFACVEDRILLRSISAFFCGSWNVLACDQLMQFTHACMLTLPYVHILSRYRSPCISTTPPPKINIPKNGPRNSQFWFFCMASRQWVTSYLLVLHFRLENTFCWILFLLSFCVVILVDWSFHYFYALFAPQRRQEKAETCVEIEIEKHRKLR